MWILWKYEGPRISALLPRIRYSYPCVGIFTDGVWKPCCRVKPNEMHRILIIPKSRVVLEKLSLSANEKKVPAFHEFEGSLRCSREPPHFPLSKARSVQSTPSHSTSWRSILMLSHLLQGLPSGLVPSVSPPKSWMDLSSPPYVLLTPPISFSIWSPEYMVRGTDHEASC